MFLAGASTLVRLSAIIGTMAFFVCLLEGARIVLNRGKERYPLIFVIGSLAVLFVASIPPSLTSSGREMFAVSIVALVLALVTWIVIRAGHLHEGERRADDDAAQPR